MKRQHRYRITIEHLETSREDMDLHEPLSFEAFNHDDLFSIVEHSRQKGLFDPDAAAGLALGTKLFGEVMMTHRTQPLFDGMREPFRAFIGRYKSAGPDN